MEGFRCPYLSLVLCLSAALWLNLAIDIQRMHCRRTESASRCSLDLVMSQHPYLFIFRASRCSLELVMSPSFLLYLQSFSATPGTRRCMRSCVFLTYSEVYTKKQDPWQLCRVLTVVVVVVVLCVCMCMCVWWGWVRACVPVLSLIHI